MARSKSVSTAARRKPANQPTPTPRPPIQKPSLDLGGEAKLVASQHWSGPLPPPGALRQFDEIIPNGADRILRMVEAEQSHRQELENVAVRAEIADTKRGHWIGGALTLLCVSGAAYTAHIGASPFVSIALVGLPLVGLIKHFIARGSRRAQKKED